MRTMIAALASAVCFAALVVPCARRLVGFGVERSSIDGVSIRRMLNHAIAGQRGYQNMSAPITTRCSVSIVGWPTYTYLRLKRSSRFRTPLFHIRSFNG